MEEGQQFKFALKDEAGSFTSIVEVYKIIGEVSTFKKPIFVMWARKPPKRAYRVYCELCKQLFNEKLTVIIDDLTPMITENRSFDEQKEMTKKHKDFFEKYDAIPIVLSEKISILDYLKIMSEIRLNRFIHFLPETERNLDEIDFKKVYNFVGNVYACQIGSKYGNLFLLGKKALGRFTAFIETQSNHKEINGIVFNVEV